MSERRTAFAPDTFERAVIAAGQDCGGDLSNRRINHWVARNGGKRNAPMETRVITVGLHMYRRWLQEGAGEIRPFLDLATRLAWIRKRGHVADFAAYSEIRRFLHAPAPVRNEAA